MKNWKNHPKKLLRFVPDPFFPLTSPGHSPRPKIDFPYHEISGPDICSLICGFDLIYNLEAVVALLKIFMGLALVHFQQ